MSFLTPALLPSTHAELELQLQKLSALPEVSRIQLDIVDGRFAAPASWPYSEPDFLVELLGRGMMLPQIDRFSYEIDVMVFEPDELLGALFEAGATRLVIHVETTTSLPRLLASIRRQSGYEKDFAPTHLSIGLAFNIDTSLVPIEPYLAEVDFVQFMGIAHVGRQGQAFDARVLKKIRDFHAAHPDLPMQVDGGVSLVTAPQLLALGVQNVVVGSALMKSLNMYETFEQFESLVSPYGV